MAEGMAAGLVGFMVSYWPYLSVAALLLVVVVFYRRFVESERSAAAEREQTLFLTFLYVLVKSG
ncbi:MAG: hypothetical protein QXN72_06680, partial [Candidatus Caldarchaeum sp.]